MPRPDLFERARKRIARAPFVGPRVDALAARHGDGYRRRVDAHLAALYQHVGADPGRFDAACDAFLEMTWEVFRMQSAFHRTGRFALDVESDAMTEIYANAELMPGRYLTGLYLAQVFWENHFEKLLFYEDAFLPRLPGAGSLLDVGSGPGTWALLALERHPTLDVTLNDISPFSRPMIEGLAAARGLSSRGFAFAPGDFTEVFGGADERFDGVVFSEVVEHLPDPEAGMARLGELLAPGGHVFFTTATNAAFYDHTAVFSDIAEIEALLARHGFEVVRHLEVEVSRAPDGRHLIDYDAVLRRSP